ncbi:MAG TPA: amino acid ABC transporter permease [Bordetella sp.]
MAFLHEVLPILWAGLWSTVLYALGCVAVGFPIAVLLCVLRLSRMRLLSGCATVYISFFRGVPLLVQLLIAFYAVPALGVDVPPWAAGLFTLALCTAAYMAEILRGGFQAIPYGQVEAAQISGLNPRQILFFIQVPQAVRLTLPSLINEAITMVKASSLISIVGVLDLTRASQNMASSTLRPLACYALAGLLYLAVTSCVAAAGHRLERTLAAGR